MEEHDCERGIPVRFEGKLYRIGAMPFIHKKKLVVDLSKFEGKSRTIVKRKVQLSSIEIFPSPEEIREQCDAIIAADTQKGRQARWNRARELHPSFENSVEVTVAELPPAFRKQWTD